MAKLVFPDGNVREYDNKTPLEIAESISVSLKKKVISAKLDDDYIEVNKPITRDGHLKLIVADDEDQDSLYVLRHSSAHLLAQALRRLYGKDVHFGVGPAIDGGFYYDFDSEYKVTEEDFKNIEKEMKRKKDFHPLQLLNKHDRVSLDLEILNIIRISLASKMLDIQSEELLSADLYFNKKDELDMGEDARIIGYVFRDFVKQRIETAIKIIEEENIWIY